MKPNLLTTAILTLFISLQVSAQAKKPAASPAASIAAGQKIYLQYCLSCHMMDGGGVPNMNPPLAGTSWVKGDKVRLIKTVKKGIVPNVDIDGQSFTNTMPAQTLLTDKQIADVLT